MARASALARASFFVLLLLQAVRGIPGPWQRPAPSPAAAGRPGSCSFSISLALLASSWVSTSSKRTFSALIRAAACWMIVLGQAQPLGDGKGVGLARHARSAAGRWARRVSTSNSQEAFSTPGGGHGVDLQLGVVGGGRHQGPQAPGVLDDGLGQGRPLHRVGAAPPARQRAPGCCRRPPPGSPRCCSCGRRRWTGTGQWTARPRCPPAPAGRTPDAAAVPGGDVQAALGHEGEQADGLQSHRLAAGVGAGDDQGVKLLPQRQVDWPPPSWGPAGGAGPGAGRDFCADSSGSHGPHPRRTACPGQRCCPGAMSRS